MQVPDMMNRRGDFQKRAVLLLLLLCCWGQQAFAQARVVLDGGIINISGGASLVLANPAGNALVRNSGHIVSEGETNTLRWHIGSSTGAYTIPWGYGSDKYLPVSFSKDAGTGPGIFTFSTYHTGWSNSAQLPGTVTNLNSGSSDNSSFVLDRFWQISARGYTAKPALSDLTLTYLDVEHSVSENTILEESLQAQRWNDVSGEWSDYAPAGAVDAVANTVRISAVASNDLYSWWALVDQARPMPVELLFFNARADGRQVRLAWETATETDNKSFIVERSRDGRQFESVATIGGAGNSQERRRYDTVDKNPFEGVSYYRIRQVDFDGGSTFSPIEFVTMSSAAPDRALAYPNPVTSGRFFVDLSHMGGQRVQIELYDLPGKKVLEHIAEADETFAEVVTGPGIRPGTYILHISGTGTSSKQKILVQ